MAGGGAREGNFNNGKSENAQVMPETARFSSPNRTGEFKITGRG